MGTRQGLPRDAFLDYRGWKHVFPCWEHSESLARPVPPPDEDCRLVSDLGRLRPRPRPGKAGADALRLPLSDSGSVSASIPVVPLGLAFSGCGLWSQAARV